LIGGRNIDLINLTSFKYEFFKYFLALIHVYSKGQLILSDLELIKKFKIALFSWLETAPTKNEKLEYEDIGLKSSTSIRTVNSFKKS
jgi:hypothetical protein